MRRIRRSWRCIARFASAPASWARSPGYPRTSSSRSCRASAIRGRWRGRRAPAALAALVAGHLDIQSAERQQLLETLAVEDRLRRVLVHVQRQIAVLDAQEDIKSQVQEELGERQREMLLREQMKAIRKELGEEEDAEEADDLKKRLDALDLPEAARKEVDRELGRLERAGRESMEAQVIRSEESR